MGFVEQATTHSATPHVLSEQAAGVVAEREWISTVKRQDSRHCIYCGELHVVACTCKTSFFVVNTDRVIN